MQLMEPLKNAYNTLFFNSFLKAFSELKPKVNKTAFLESIFTPEWDSYELKERSHHIALVLHQFLDADFKTAIQEIKNLIPILQKHHISGGYEYLFLPNYVETYGQDHLVESISSFEIITPFISCEFAIRPFIVTHPKYVLAKINEWTFHSNQHLRRLASEGCRPRLPWGMALAAYKKDPTAIIPILENLLNDESLYVRKSVANNLNDISKDNPEILIELTEKYYGETEATNWILKHANRNLLKQAEPRIMEVFGFGNTTQIDIQNFEISSTSILLGDELHFSFDVINNDTKPTLIRLEYAVYYVKNNGTLSKKIFQIGQKEYASNSTHQIKKKQHFKPISTRKYYFGTHKIAIIANGKEFDLIPFELYE